MRKSTFGTRRDHYDTAVTESDDYQTLHDLLYATGGIEITWLPLQAASPLVGISLADASIRSRSGAPVVVLIRNRKLTANPKSIMVFDSSAASE